ncbi:MAG: hypothetical protein Q8R24_10415 [Legionellaceae bacterium]|nr:hypothetical protein [Legionellaceae bacterium]
MGVLGELEGLIVSKCGSIKTLMSMTKLEVRLARLSIFPLVINVCMLLVVLMVIWMTAMAALGYGIFLACHSIMAAFGSVLLFNLLMFGLLRRYLLFNIRKMSFEQTRKYFGSISTLSEYDGTEQSKECDDGDRDSRTAIAEPTA